MFWERVLSHLINLYGREMYFVLITLADLGCFLTGRDSLVADPLFLKMNPCCKNHIKLFLIKERKTVLYKG